VENKGSENLFATSEKRANVSQAANGVERCPFCSNGGDETGSLKKAATDSNNLKNAFPPSS